MDNYIKGLVGHSIQVCKIFNIKVLRWNKTEYFNHLSHQMKQSANFKSKYNMKIVVKVCQIHSLASNLLKLILIRSIEHVKRVQKILIMMINSLLGLNISRGIMVI